MTITGTDCAHPRDRWTRKIETPGALVVCGDCGATFKPTPTPSSKKATAKQPQTRAERREAAPLRCVVCGKAESRHGLVRSHRFDSRAFPETYPHTEAGRRWLFEQFRGNPGKWMTYMTAEGTSQRIQEIEREAAAPASRLAEAEALLKQSLLYLDYGVEQMALFVGEAPAVVEGRRFAERVSTFLARAFLNDLAGSAETGKD